MTKFIHVRNVDNDGISNLGGGTVAYKLADENNWFVSVAKCMDIDNFCKADGRRRAKSRLEGKCGFVVPHSEGYSLLDDLAQLNESNISVDEFPTVNLTERQAETFQDILFRIGY